MKTQPNKFHFLVYLAVLSIVGFLATDMYLPAFEAMRLDLNTSKANIGVSLSLFLGGFAIAQLVWGPLSDKYGKPKAILWGLSIFAITSILIFFTRNITFLLVLRLVQAIGACSAAVCWQALVIERYPADKTQGVFASIMPLVALSPALSPLLGVYILKHFGWQYIFLFIALICVLLIGYTFTLENKTNQISKADDSSKTNYFTFLKSRVFIGNVMIYGFCSAGFFAWLTGCPFFLTDLGYSEAEIGLSFVPQTIAFMLGGYGYRLVANKIEGKKLMPWLLLIYSLCMNTILALAIFTVPTIVTLLIPFCFMAFANGAAYPIAVANALKPYPNDSGKASAFQNTIQLGVCFLASTGVSLFSQTALMATAIVMAATVIFVIIGYQLAWSGNIPANSQMKKVMQEEKDKLGDI